MQKRSTIVTFWLLAVVFLVIVSQILIPSFRDLLKGSQLFLIPMAFFCLLGIILLLLVLREKEGGKLKKFLLLTGASAAGFFVFVILHNVFYAINFLTKDIFILNYLMQGLYVLFFFIAVPICPIVFLIGLIGSVRLLMRKG